MRGTFCWMVLVVACGAGRPTNDGGSTTGADSPPDAGSPPEAAPAPAAIGAVACPAKPELLWTRTFADEVDFRGAADEDGNLYRVEYDPPPTFSNPDAPAWLASADRNGRDRYRVPAAVASTTGAFLVASGKVVTSKGAVLAAYDNATGALSWTLDLSATYSNRYAAVSGIVDPGDGTLAFAIYDYGVASGLHRVAAATGALVWSSVGGDDAAYRIAGSNGLGDALATGNPASSYSPEQGYHSAADVFVVGASGQQAWSHRIEGPVGRSALVAWSSGRPWLEVAGSASLSPAGDYVAVPSSWFSAVAGSDSGFALSFGADAATPIAVNVVRGSAVIAQGAVAGTSTYFGISAWPFLAGAAGDHLILLSQNLRPNPGLCHPSRFEAASLSRFDATSSYQCAFDFQGESAIEGAALLDGLLVLGRRTYLNQSCTHDVQPVTIEAYALAGESLAPSGWVQREGNRGLGLRPR